MDRQETAKWGSKVIDQIGDDLQREFPGMSGFCRQNIDRMRAFFLAYSSRDEIVSAPARQLAAPSHVLEIPWFHTVTIRERVKPPAARLWYAQAAVEHGWSRAVLAHQIETDLFGRTGKAVTNFEKALPAATSDLARETLKDPFTFAFLTLAADHAEADLERGLVAHIHKFLLELGVGFAFVGSRYHLEVGGDDVYLDRLFYHLTLRCFVVFDPLCGGPHKGSRVASSLMWRSDRATARYAGGSSSRTPHDRVRYSVRRNSINPASSFHGTPSFPPATSQLASALAFISRSTSA